MRFPKIALLGIAALAGGALNAQEIKLDLEPTAPPSFTDEQALEALGWFLAHQNTLVALGFTKEEVDVVARGMTLAVTGQPSPSDLKAIGPTIQALISRRREAALTRLRDEGKVETEKFMAEIRAKAGVVSMDNGMCYEVVSAGTGPKPRADQMVKVNYTGRLVNGQVFDSSEAEPVEFLLGGVIEGWRDGLQQVNQGSKVVLYIPPQLAYGDEGTPNIPPASTLIFEVDLLEVKDAPPAAEAPGLAPAPAVGG